MKRFRTPFTPGDIRDKNRGILILRHKIERLNAVSQLEDADESTLCFFASPAYLEAARSTRAGLVLCPADTNPEELPGQNLCLTPNPYLAFVLQIRAWQHADAGINRGVIDSSVVIGEDCEIDDTVTIGHGTVIGNGCRIGANTRIQAGCVIGEGCVIGKDSLLHARVTVYDGCVMGDGVILHSGVVIGADGFGYIPLNGIQEKVPQVGIVRIGNQVEIGANTAIDRATLGETVIGDGTKIDNLVQIGHNCRVGKNCVICGQAGLAGSTILGDGVYVAGQVGFSGHQKIGDGVMIGAQSGVVGDIEANSKIFGSPAVAAGQHKRMFLALRQLPDLLRKMKKLIET